jgi:hypothetical protein
MAYNNTGGNPDVLSARAPDDWMIWRNGCSKAICQAWVQDYNPKPFVLDGYGSMPKSRRDDFNVVFDCWY